MGRSGATPLRGWDDIRIGDYAGAERTWGGRRIAAEGAREVALVGEAGGEADVRERQFRGG